MRSATMIQALCVVFLLLGSASGASKTLDVVALGSGPVSLTEYFAVLEDPSLQLTLDEVQRPAQAGRFSTTLLSVDGGSLGYTRSAYWLRLALHNSSDRAIEQIIELAYARISDLQFHQPTAEGGYRTTATGSVTPWATRAYPSRHFVFPVTLPPHSDQVFYFRLQSNSPLIVPAQLWAPEAFHAYERNDYVAQAWYFGMSMAMVLFNLLLFIALRDTIYFLYVFFVTSCALTFADQNGLAKEFLWPDSPTWLDFSTDIGYSISLLALLLFMRKMLDTRVAVPKTDRLIKLLAGLYLLSPLAFALSYKNFVAPAAVTYFLTVPVIFGVGLYCARQGQRSAIYFLAAFSMLLVAGAITSLRGWGLLPSNTLTVNALQFGSALEMLLLAFALADRFNEIRREKAKAQHEALQAQQQLVENLQSSERLLEVSVEQRTAELMASNTALEATLDDLRATQAQLIRTEKMASLGQLVANVAHEINTPIGAVKSSGRSVADALDDALENIPRLFERLDQGERDLFSELIHRAREPKALLSSREERALVREVARELEQVSIGDARNKASILVQLGAHLALANYLPLVRHAEVDFILTTANNVALIINSTSNINTAVDRVSKIIFALKSFTRSDSSNEMTDASLQNGIETVLTIYQNQIRQGTKLIRQFEDVPPLRCLPNELHQVWTHLIHNALQAMKYQGTLTMGLRRVGDEALVRVGDSGCGIPDAIRPRIFEPFFTTQPPGEGSGLGLDIVKKIIHKHRGRIEVNSEVGVGSTFSVFLPYV